MKLPGIFPITCSILLFQPVLAQDTTASRYDVILTEIMADPSPPQSLPNAEFIELKNRSNKAINLAGWKLATAVSTSGSFPNLILLPDSLIVITSSASLPALSAFGKTVSLPSFPGLPNENGLLMLLSKQGTLIHSVSYTRDWYRNSVKSEGGWSLEMIDTHFPCSGSSNWTASMDPAGGTPCRSNSVNSSNPDTQPPQLLRTWSPDSLTVIALFNEPLDSSSASRISNYSITNGLQFNSLKLVQPVFDKIKFTLASPLNSSLVYELSVQATTDCAGNEIGNYNKAKVGLAKQAVTHDLAINEILFNPRPGAFDYVEIFNPSNHIIDASTLYLANRDAAGNPASVKKITDESYFIFPGDYLVLTEDVISVSREYLVRDPGAILQLSSLPSFPDDKGAVLLLNQQGLIVDEVPYSEKWHFALIANPEGISLERIDTEGPSNEPHNWHSAASSAGYGTPGYRNSQYRQTAGPSEILAINPRIFSPDNDGYDDVISIHYDLPEPGFVAGITIFDNMGRPVRSLVKNALLGINGGWTWDGLDDNKKPVATGPYILFAEIFNLKGEVRRFKAVVVVGKP